MLLSYWVVMARYYITGCFDSPEQVWLELPQVAGASYQIYQPTRT